jgi:protein SCO1/2
MARPQPLAIAVVAAGLLLLIACAPIGERTTDAAEGPSRAPDADPDDAFAYRSDVRPVSIGEVIPDFAMIDVTGRPRTLHELRGKVVVMTVFAAPGDVEDAEILDRATTIEARLAPRLAAEVTLVTLLLDPSTDDRSALRAVVERATRDDVAWIVAAADPGALSAIAGALQIALWQAADGGVGHTFNTVIIDRDGRLADRFPGLDGWSSVDVIAAASAIAQH